MNKFRAVFTEPSPGDMKGKIEIEAAPDFMLSCLLEIIQMFAGRHGVTVTEVLNDINALDKGKVK